MERGQAMIQHLLPHKARYIPSQNTFSAPFTGLYDFNIAANVNQVVIKMAPGLTYFIDNYSFAGNITQEDFLSAINAVPSMKLSRKNDSDNVYTGVIPLNQFSSEKPATVFVSSNKGNDELLITFAGIINQTANLVGVSPVSFTVSLAIYAIDNNDFNKELSSVLSPSFSKRINQ